MRRSFSRTLNGPGALVPSPMFVAATVRLLLGRRRRSSTRRRARSSTRWPPGGWRDGGCWYTPRTRAPRASPDGWTTSSPGTVPVGPPHARRVTHRPHQAGQAGVMSYRNTLQADALKLVAEELRSALAAGGDLPEDWLAAFGDGGSDLLMALVRSP